MKASVMTQRLRVPFDFSVAFTRGTFKRSNPTLLHAVNRLDEKRQHRVLTFIDRGVASAHPGLTRSLAAYGRAHARGLKLETPPVLMPGGESVKDGWERVQGLVQMMLKKRLDRQSFVLIIGGGAVLDAVGFAASLVHRGLRVIRMPTTVLAQNDSGVGVKTSMNLGGKNLLGTFAPPFAVINDFDFLDTLPDRDWRGGIAEAFKVAMIKDAAFFRWLCKNAGALRRRDVQPMENLIRRCAALHLEHIRTGGDPFEMGRARPLDFGHWAAHRLEIMTGYQLGHGQAVAVGIALDACYATRRGWLAAPDFERLCSALVEAGLPIWHPALARRDRRGRLAILEGLRDFREHLGGELCVTLPDGLGRRHEVHEMDTKAIAWCIGFLQVRACADHPNMR